MNAASGLASWCSWAYLAAGNAELAERAARIGLGDGTGVPPPDRDRLEADLALLAGDLPEAIAHLRAALEFLDEAGYQTDACPIRRRLAGLLDLQGQPEAARAELQKVYEMAHGRGLLLEERLAAEELRKAGPRATKEEATVRADVSSGRQDLNLRSLDLQE